SGDHQSESVEEPVEGDTRIDAAGCRAHVAEADARRENDRDIDDDAVRGGERDGRDQHGGRHAEWREQRVAETAAQGLFEDGDEYRDREEVRGPGSQA